jgi:hypothetical protein
LRLVSLGHHLAHPPELPEGYILGEYVSGYGEYGYMSEGPYHARDRGLVVACILAETRWSLPELEALLDQSGGTFVPVFRKLWGVERQTPYGNALWPWGAGPFLERLVEYEGSGGRRTRGCGSC